MSKPISNSSKTDRVAPSTTKKAKAPANADTPRGVRPSVEADREPAVAPTRRSLTKPAAANPAEVEAQLRQNRPPSTSSSLSGPGGSRTWALATRQPSTENPDEIKAQVAFRNLDSSTGESDADTHRVSQYEEDGVQYTQTVLEGEDHEITQLEFSQDGVDFTTTTTVFDDGRTVVVQDADRDGVVETTTTESQQVEGDLVDHLPPEVQAVAAANSESGQAGPVQQTTTTTVVRDTNVQPATVTVLEETTRLEQFTALPADQFELAADSNLVLFELPSPRSLPLQSTYQTVAETFEVDPEQSGQVLSYTFGSVTGPGGEPEPVSNFGSEYRIVGTGQNGQDVLISSGAQEALDSQGRTIAITQVNEERGTIPRSNIDTEFRARVAPGEYPEFSERLGQGDYDYVNYREVTTIDPATFAQETVQEFGDYDTPSADGRSVTVASTADGTSSLSYRLVQEDGQHVQEQTVIPGTGYSSVTETRYDDAGGFVRNSQESVGDIVVSQTEQQQRYVDIEDLNRPLGISDSDWRNFLESQGDGPVLVDSLSQQQFDEDGEPGTSTDSIQFSGSGAVVGLNTEIVNGFPQQTRYSQVPGGDPPGSVRLPTGQVVAVDDEGNLLVDGEIQENIPAEVRRLARSGLSLAAIGQAFAQHLGGGEAAGVFANRIPVAALRLGGVALGLYDVFQGESPEARVRGGAQAATSGAGLGAAGAHRFGLNSLRTGGRLLGALGGGLTIGVGLSELAQGEYVRGSLDLLAGGGFAVAAVFPPSAPIALTVAGVATLVRIGVDVFAGNNERFEVESLEF